MSARSKRTTPSTAASAYRCSMGWPYTVVRGRHSAAAVCAGDVPEHGSRRLRRAIAIEEIAAGNGGYYQDDEDVLDGSVFHFYFLIIFSYRQIADGSQSQKFLKEITHLDFSAFYFNLLGIAHRDNLRLF